jgi:hypothetical protein
MSCFNTLYRLFSIEIRVGISISSNICLCFSENIQIPFFLLSWNTQLKQWLRPEISATQETERGRITKSKILYQDEHGGTYTGGIDRRLIPKSGPGKKLEILSEKQPTAKRAGGMEKVVECLHSKHKAWVLTSVYKKREEKRA